MIPASPMSEPIDAATALNLKKCREALHADFDRMVSPERVDSIFDDSITQLRSGGHFLDYLGALAEKLARERLKALARSEGRVPRGVPDVLFVGLHDTGRGQMGAAIMDSLAEGRVTVHSAGTSGQQAPVDPSVAAAMRELGIELDDEYSKPLTPEVLAGADVVVTMSRSTGIVEIPEGVRHVDWRIGDPRDAPAEEVRRIRDEIRGRVERLLEDLGTAGD